MHAQTRNLIVLAALALGACTVYRPEIRQGNYVDPTKYAQLKPGMTRDQVRFLVGPPMVADSFHPQQWDYFFWLETQTIKAGDVRRHLIVHFDGDVVSRIEQDGVGMLTPAAAKPDAPPAANAPPAAAPATKP